MLKLKTKSVEGKRLPGTVGDGTHAQTLPMTKPHRVTAGINVKKILAPTDFSSASLAGVRYALNLAKELDAEVVIYNMIALQEIVAFARSAREDELAIMRSQGFGAACESQLRLFVKQNIASDLASVKVKYKVEIGTPETNIIEATKSEGADLIVMSSRGKSRFARMFLGSVTESVLRNAPCPVLAIPAEYANTMSDKLKKAA